MAQHLPPRQNTLSLAAAPTVGRNYHSEGMLLPNGQVMTLGGNALFPDPDDTKPAIFEKRMEIYTPPYLFHGPQPTITDAPAEAAVGSRITVASPDAATITKARLIRPSAATHATDLEQRSVALDIARTRTVRSPLTIPGEAAPVSPRLYMLFLVVRAGTPSVARLGAVT